MNTVSDPETYFGRDGDCPSVYNIRSGIPFLYTFYMRIVVPYDDTVDPIRILARSAHGTKRGHPASHRETLQRTMLRNDPRPVILRSAGDEGSPGCAMRADPSASPQDDISGFGRINRRQRTRSLWHKKGTVSRSYIHYICVYSFPTMTRYIRSRSSRE